MASTTAFVHLCQNYDVFSQNLNRSTLGDPLSHPTAHRTLGSTSLSQSERSRSKTASCEPTKQRNRAAAQSSVSAWRPSWSSSESSSAALKLSRRRNESKHRLPTGCDSCGAAGAAGGCTSLLQADAINEAWIFCCLILELALLARAGAWRLKVLANAAFVGIFNLQLP